MVRCHGCLCKAQNRYSDRAIAPPNSSQQPTTCGSLARRFRASFGANLRVALPESEGTWRLSERTLGRLCAVSARRDPNKFLLSVDNANPPGGGFHGRRKSRDLGVDGTRVLL